MSELLIVPVKSARPHADLIRAFADGAEIQIYDQERCCWVDDPHQNFHPSDMFRIKPEMVEVEQLRRWDAPKTEKGLPYFYIFFGAAHPTICEAVSGDATPNIEAGRFKGMGMYRTRDDAEHAAAQLIKLGVRFQ